MTPLHFATTEMLFEQQGDSLRDIHATLDEPAVLRNFRELHTIDVWHPDYGRTLGIDLHKRNAPECSRILRDYSSVERLSFGTELRYPINFLDRNFRSASPRNSELDHLICLPALKELSLWSLDADVFWFGFFEHLVSIRRLTHLSLWGCLIPEELIKSLVQTSSDAPLQ